jgi:hypothetical protein
VAIVVQLAVEHGVDTVRGGLDHFPEQVDTTGVVEAEETEVGLRTEGRARGLEKGTGRKMKKDGIGKESKKEWKK